MECEEKRVSTILLSNLPPNCTTAEIVNALSIYGPVQIVFLCREYFLDVQYDLRSAYVTCCSSQTIEFLFTYDIDIIIRGYLVSVDYSDKSVLRQSLLVLGLPKGTTESDIAVALRLDPLISISIEKEGGEFDDGFAILSIPPQIPRASVESLIGKEGFSVNDRKIAVKHYPMERSDRVVNVRCQYNFLNLRNLERFHDFRLVVPGTTYNVSKRILSMSSPVIAETQGNEYKMTIRGDYEMIIDALYGAEISVTTENCRFVHAVASVLRIQSLILRAGAVYYDLLDERNVIEEANMLWKNKYDMQFVIEYIASHVSKSPKPLSSKLPREIVTEVARSRHIASLSKQDIDTIFGDAIDTGILSRRSISYTDNDMLDINNNRAMLINHLSEKKK